MDSVIPIIALCGVGADLFSLPLFMCTIMAAAGFVPIEARLEWLGSWWMILLAGLVLCGEMTIDTMADRRRRFFKRAWPVLQHVLSAVTSAIVVHALAVGLDPVHRIATLGAAWSTTGVLKEGAVERFKSFVDWVIPG